MSAGQMGKALRSTCAHEAGHAFTQWYLGFAIDYVVVQHSPRFSAAGNVVLEFAGRMAGDAIVCEASPPIEDPTAADRSWRRHEVARAERFLFMVAAGPIAEAMQSRVSRDYIWFTASCSRDYDVALRTIRDWSLCNGEEALDEACARASSLLRSSKAKESIKALSDALYTHGRLDSHDVDNIVRPFFGGRKPALDCWSESWPGTLKELADARVPIFDDDYAGMTERAKRQWASFLEA